MNDEWSAIVLAGGVGSRLRPLTSLLPKPIVPVCNKPMIDYNLELLRSAGITGKIVIVARYLKEEIERYFKNNDRFSDLEIVIPDVDPLDTADAVRKTANFVDSPNFIVTMADIVTNIPLRDFMTFHLEKGAMASITLKDMPEPRAFGVIMLNDESRILLFLEKPLPQELGLATLTFSKKEVIHLHSNLVNTGIYAFKHTVLDILSEVDDLMDFGKHVFPYLAREYGIFGYARKNYYWMDAGKPQTYLYTNWDVLRKWAYPFVPDGHEDPGPIWWQGGHHSIHHGVKILPPTVIGEEVEIQEDSTIGELTVIGKNSIIGKNCTIRKSVIWDNVKIGSNVKMTESIICNNVTLAEGSILAPGTVIGANTKISVPIKTIPDQIINENSVIE